MIKLVNISKTYLTNVKEPGVKGSIKSLFKSNLMQIKALENINFSINEGDFLGLIGPNGAGKTTLIKLMTGLLYPDDNGSITVLGKYNPFQKKNDFLKIISLVSGQKNQLLWDLTAMDSFLLNKSIYKIEDNEFHNTINYLVELLDVKEKLNVPVRKLSLGQRMKLELILSLIHTPKILFLDEPTIGLDFSTQKAMRNFLKEYNIKYNATIILTSHNIEDIKICNQIICLKKGKMIYNGTLSDLNKSSNLLQYKTIEVMYGYNFNTELIKQYGEVLFIDKLKLILRVTINRLPQLMQYLFEKCDIQDISFLENDIESVLEKLYK